MSINFVPLYFLENPSINLIEIKRLDNPTETDLSKIYYWFIFNKKTTQLIHCTFINMQRTETNEARTFKEGLLTFDKTNGLFIDTATHIEYPLTTTTHTAASPTLRACILDYLKTITNEPQ